MVYSHITCLPDLLRGTRAFPSGFFDIVREPIRQGCGIDIGSSSAAKLHHGLMDGFDIRQFQLLAGIDTQHPDHQLRWCASYHAIAEPAVRYLFEHLPEASLVLSFEIPPWLTHACAERGVPILDLRPSPLRFGRDLYMALRSSDQAVNGRIAAHVVSEEELRLEAGLLTANVSMHQARLEEAGRYQFDDLESCTIFVGQAPYDASLIASDGHSLRCNDFAEQIIEISQGRRLLHKGHPFALEFAKEERAALAEITGLDVADCQQSGYQILSRKADLRLVGISSGMLQEARWFGKVADVLHQPYVPLAEPGVPAGTGEYQQVHFQTLSSPEFWHQILTPDRQAPRLAALRPVAHNHARETLDQWWDYSKVLTWERTLPLESFQRSGGGLLRTRAEALERQVLRAPAPRGRDTQMHHPDGHDLRLNSGERQVATTYAGIRADHRFRYEWADRRIPSGGFGLDIFCGNGYGTSLLAKARNVLGVDASTEAIRLAEEHYRSPRTLFAANYYPFDLPAETFDFIVSLESIEHLVDGASFFDALLKALKPGGTLVFSTPCEEAMPLARMDNHFHFRHYTLQATLELASSGGLELQEWAGQNTYITRGDGTLGGVLPDADMHLMNNQMGQFLIMHCRKRM